MLIHEKLCCQKATQFRNPLEENRPEISFQSLLRSCRSNCKDYNDCGRAVSPALQVFGILALVVSLCGNTICGEDTLPTIHRNAFESAPTFWKVDSESLSQVVKTHTVAGRHGRPGQACEQLFFQSPQRLPSQRIAIDLPKAIVFDELKAGVWVRSNCASVRMLLRVQFPHQLDPRANKPLTIEIPGAAYTETNDWQHLTIETTDDLKRGTLIRVRSQLANGLNPVELDSREMFVEQMVIEFQVPAGQSGLWLDDLTLGPIVTPPSIADIEHTQVVRGPIVSIRGDRVFRDEKPFFPMFTLYHGESLEAVRQTGVNTIWIPDYKDEHILTALADMNIGAIAQPPMPSPEDAIQQTAGISSVPAWTSPVWAWMLGVDIPASKLQYVSAWIDQVRDADRQQQRPIFADVQGNERAFHRNLSFLGTSQFTMHSDVEMTEYYQRLKQVPNNALFGKPMFTFVTTEPSAEMLAHRPPDATLPIVEPELIMLQGYAAIAAGYKGIGFWKQIPFNETVTGLNERILAIRLFTQYCSILEPWLANGRAAGNIRVLIDGQDEHAGDTRLERNLTSRWDRIATHQNQLTDESDIRATRINSGAGILILPVWYGDGSQCVPGTRAAKSIRMVVSGCDEPLAWEVTPTRVSQINLELERIAGGLEIRLKDFDQQSAIVITRDQSAIAELTRRCNQVKHQSAETWLQLAELKLKRVRDVHEQLTSIAPPVTTAKYHLQRATDWMTRAREEFEVQHDHECRLASQRALQHLRTLQRAHWDNAQAPMPCTTASLDATNFQTLPDHWRFMKQIEESPSISDNLIPSGNFEDQNAFLTDGWFNASDLTSQTQFQIRSMANGKFLTIAAGSTPEQGFAPTVMLSPDFPVLAGDILAITGQIQIPEALDPVSDGLLIYEAYEGQARSQSNFESLRNLGNRIGALRENQATQGWKPFTLYRTVPQDGFAHVRFELDCPGTIAIDNLQVRKVAR